MGCQNRMTREGERMKAGLDLYWTGDEDKHQVVHLFCAQPGRRRSRGSLHTKLYGSVIYSSLSMHLRPKIRRRIEEEGK